MTGTRCEGCDDDRAVLRISISSIESSELIDHVSLCVSCATHRSIVSALDHVGFGSKALIVAAAREAERARSTKIER